MRSTKFSCERTLFIKDLTRFWPLWAAYTLLWFLLIPLNIFNQGESLAHTYAEFDLSGWAGNLAMEAVCQYTGTIIAVIYGVLCAMAVWSYLYNSRSVNMTHALPVRREGQFAAHFLSGVTFFVLPHAVILLLTLVAGLVTGSHGDFLRAVGAMGILTLMCLFFFSLATLCAFVTGHLVALPAFYLIFNFLASGLAGLLDWVAANFLFGFTTDLSQSKIVEWLTPARRMFSQLDWMYDYEWNDLMGSSTRLTGIPTHEDGIAVPVTTRLEGLSLVLVYALVALVLAALALLLYRRRHLECAGDVVAVPWLRPVFQYGVAFCAALAGAYMLVDLLGRRDRMLLTVLLILWGIIGFFAARMLLQKSLRVFKDGWKGAAAVGAAMALLCLGLTVDVFGLERKIPDAERIVSVYISGPDSLPGDGASYPHVTTDDPALIRQVLALHQTVIEHRKQLKEALDAQRREGRPADGAVRSISIEYQLDNGSFLARDYRQLRVSQEDLNDPSSIAAALRALLDNRDFVRLGYNLDAVQPDRLTQVAVRGLDSVKSTQNTKVGERIYYSPLSDQATLAQQEGDGDAYQAGQTFMAKEGPIATAETVSDQNAGLYPASVEALAALWRAVEADFDAGNLGRRWLFADEAYYEHAGLANLDFSWYERAESAYGEVYYNQRSLNIALTTQAEHTFAALEDLGVFDNGGYIVNFNGDRVYPSK